MQVLISLCWLLVMSPFSWTMTNKQWLNCFDYLVLQSTAIAWRLQVLCAIAAGCGYCVRSPGGGHSVPSFGQCVPGDRPVWLWCQSWGLPKQSTLRQIYFHSRLTSTQLTPKLPKSSIYWTAKRLLTQIKRWECVSPIRFSSRQTATSRSSISDEFWRFGG